MPAVRNKQHKLEKLSANLKQERQNNPYVTQETS